MGRVAGKPKFEAAFAMYIVNICAGRHLSVTSRGRSSREPNLEFVLVRDRLSRSVEDVHCTLGQAVVFLEFGVHKEYGFARLRGAFFQSLFEQISCAFQFCTTLGLGESNGMNAGSSRSRCGYSHIVW